MTKPVEKRRNKSAEQVGDGKKGELMEKFIKPLIPKSKKNQTEKDDRCVDGDQGR